MQDASCVGAHKLTFAVYQDIEIVLRIMGLEVGEGELLLVCSFSSHYSTKIKSQMEGVATKGEEGRMGRKDMFLRIEPWVIRSYAIGPASHRWAAAVCRGIMSGHRHG